MSCPTECLNAIQQQQSIKGQRGRIGPVGPTGPVTTSIYATYRNEEPSPMSPSPPPPFHTIDDIFFGWHRQTTSSTIDFPETNAIRLDGACVGSAFLVLVKVAFKATSDMASPPATPQWTTFGVRTVTESENYVYYDIPASSDFDTVQHSGSFILYCFEPTTLHITKEAGGLPSATLPWEITLVRIGPNDAP